MEIPLCCWAGRAVCHSHHQQFVSNWWLKKFEFYSKKKNVQMYNDESIIRFTWNSTVEALPQSHIIQSDRIKAARAGCQISSSAAQSGDYLSRASSWEPSKERIDK
jgi:hypothetical protein